MSWSKQKILLKEHDPSRTDIKLMADNIPDIRVKALFSILYLTAGRISEVVKKMRVRHIQYDIRQNDRVLALVKMSNEKHRIQKEKIIPIPIDRETEAILFGYVKVYMDELRQDDIMWDFGRIRAYQLLQKYTHFNPHYLRHLRLTHLAVYNDFTDQQLVKFAGWTDSRPAKSYVQLNWKDLIRKI